MSFIFTPSHVSSPSFEMNTKQDDWFFFPETCVLFGRASAGFHCTMNPCAPQISFIYPPSWLFSSCRLDAVFCVFCQYWETVKLFTLTGTCLERERLFRWCSGEVIVKRNLVLVSTVSETFTGPGHRFLRGTLRNRCHIDASKCTTQLPHKKKIPLISKVLQIFKPYAYIVGSKGGQTFYWLNLCLFTVLKKNDFNFVDLFCLWVRWSHLCKSDSVTCLCDCATVCFRCTMSGSFMLYQSVGKYLFNRF